MIHVKDTLYRQNTKKMEIYLGILLVKYEGEHFEEDYSKIVKM